MHKIIYILLLLSLGFSQAKKKNMGGDLTPKSNSENALVSKLNVATIITTNLEETKLFYEKGWQLQLDGPLKVDSKTKRVQRRLWGIPNDIGWDTYLLSRPSVPTAIKIRLLVLDAPTPHIHSSWDASEVGPFSLGFPNTKHLEIDAKLRKLGFGATSGEASQYEIQNPDGGSYLVQETIFLGPDFVKAVGIHRGGGKSQLSPVDPASGYGGPGYSAQILEEAQPVLDFYTKVLDMEIRSDREWTTSGVLGVPAGTRYRFSLVYSKGSTEGHLLFVDPLNHETYASPVSPRPPYRGLAMWSFATKNIKEVIKRARQHNFKIHSGPIRYNEPIIGSHTSMTLIAPNNYMVEVYQLD